MNDERDPPKLDDFLREIRRTERERFRTWHFPPISTILFCLLLAFAAFIISAYYSIGFIAASAIGGLVWYVVCRSTTVTTDFHGPFERTETLTGAQFHEWARAMREFSQSRECTRLLLDPDAEMSRKFGVIGFAIIAFVDLHAPIIALLLASIIDIALFVFAFHVSLPESDSVVLPIVGGVIAGSSLGAGSGMLARFANRSRRKPI